MRYLILCSVFLMACQTNDLPEFNDWYAEQQKSTHTEMKLAKIYTAEFYSSPLLIDTIYRSMLGPYEIKPIQLDAQDESLLWIVSYESMVEAVDQKTPLKAAFMCHNNLNYDQKEKSPWQIKTSGANSRIFTLSEGQTSLDFPKGFGLPMQANQGLKMVSQVLNHKEKDIHIESRHHVRFKYLKDSELKSPLKALYQQSIFVTKQISGPAGSYGLPHLCVDHHLDSNQIKGAQPQHDCSINFSRKNYDPYNDKHGRRYTGHWKLPYGEERLKTDVTQMLDLDRNSRIHMIGVHLHPYAKALSLWDVTTDSLLYAANILTKADGFGFDSVGYYKDSIGIPVYKDHHYELVSEYECKDSTEAHTAMAVMYLYLSE